MKWLYSIAFRVQALSLGILTFISVAFLLVFIENTEKTNTENLRDLSEAIMNYVTVGVQNTLAPAMDMVNSAATFVDNKKAEELEDLFAKMLTADSSVYDLYYGTAKSRFAGGMFAGGSGWRPYEDPESADWDQVARPWFIEATQAGGKIIMTEPYIDAETGRYVFTIAKTAKSVGGNVIGVVAADIFLDAMNKIMQSRKITEDGVTFLVDTAGNYLTHLDTAYILNKNLFDDFADFKGFKKELLKAESHIVFAGDRYMVASLVDGTDWHLVSSGSMKTLDKTSITSILLVILVSIVIAAIVSLFFGRTIIRSIKGAMHSFDIIGAGDVSHRLKVDGKDEIARMSKHFNKFMDKLQDFMRGINKDMITLNDNTHKLSNISGNLADVAELTVSKSNSVVKETQKVTKSIEGIANMATNTSNHIVVTKGAAEQMGEHINSIILSIEKMNKNIEEIGTNTEGVCNVADAATEKAKNATDVISKLGSAAKEIGQVTDVIKKIADKTNLLALNATIEAASAGEAGKGFAVVAGEIKELANQSAASADDIARRIESIQSGTNDAVSVIHDVSDIITKINLSVRETEGHVEQQNRASSEIVHNVAASRDEAKKMAASITDIADGASGTSSDATEIAMGARDISHNIKSVSEVAEQIQDAAIDIHSSVDGFSQISINLQNKLKQFRV